MARSIRLGLVTAGAFAAIYLLAQYSNQYLTPVLTPPLQAQALLTAALTPTPSPTPAALSSPTPLTRPTEEPYLTATPLPTPTPFFLTNPHPSNLDLVRFIFNRHHPTYDANGLDAQLSAGTYADFSRQDVDVNGDGIPEVVIRGQYWFMRDYVAILTFDSVRGQWLDMFYIEDSLDWACIASNLRVNADHVEVTFRKCFHGTGMWGEYLEQHWLRCNKQTCNEVWNGRLLYSITQEQAYGDSVYYEIGQVQHPNPNTIQFTIQRFGLGIMGRWADPTPVAQPPLRVIGPDVRETWRWNGKSYELVSSEQLTPGSELVREYDQTTVDTNTWLSEILKKPFERHERGTTFWDENGIKEAIANFWGITSDLDGDPKWGTKVYSPEWGQEYGAPIAAARDNTGNRIAAVIGSKLNTQCRLNVQRFISMAFVLVGRIDLPCIPNLTRIAWMDVDGDGTDELLFLTVPVDLDHNEAVPWLEQLTIYRATTDLKQIAQVEGVLNGPDGVGVEWQNGQKGFEVLAGIAPDDCADFSCLDSSRRFETYRWDSLTQELQLESKQ